jgi:hypothetical protein
MASIFILILNGIVAITALAAVLVTILYWKEHQNPIDKGTVLIVFSGVTSTIFGFIMSVISTALGQPEVIRLYIGGLQVNYIFLALAGGVYYWFLAYLLKLKKFYLPPFILVFWVCTYIVITGQTPVLWMFMLIATVLAFSFLIKNAVVNKNGISFALAVFSLINVFNGFNKIQILFFIIQILSYTNILLGVNGFYDDKIFFDRKERKQIQSTWISRKITI